MILLVYIRMAALLAVSNLIPVWQGSPFTKTSQKHDVSHQVCPPATKDDILNFQHAMGVCFKAAVDAGLSIAVSPRLDDGWADSACCSGRSLEECRVMM